MAFVYEVNGQRVEFEKEPTQEDIDEAARQLGARAATAPGPVAPEKSQMRQEAEGVATMLAVPAAQALQTVVENPIQSAAGAYGTYKTAQLANAGIDALKSVKTPPVAAPAPVAPVAPPVAPPVATASPILGANGQPIMRPVAPPAAAAPAPAAAQTGIMDKAAQMVRQLAANRIVQGAVRIGGTAAAAMTPGNIGQNYPFPQSGPMAGSEINPGTGRPWTQQELDAYRAQYGG